MLRLFLIIATVAMIFSSQVLPARSAEAQLGQPPVACPRTVEEARYLLGDGQSPIGAPSAWWDSPAGFIAYLGNEPKKFILGERCLAQIINGPRLYPGETVDSRYFLIWRVKRQPIAEDVYPQRPQLFSCDSEIDAISENFGVDKSVWTYRFEFQGAPTTNRVLITSTQRTKVYHVTFVTPPRALVRLGQYPNWVTFIPGDYVPEGQHSIDMECDL